MNKNIYKILYEEAHGFLIQNTGDGFIEKQFVCTKYPMPETLNGVYQHLLKALISTKSMQEIIGPIEAMTQIMFGFDPIKIHECYGDQWEKMYEKIIKELRLSAFDNGNNQDTYWETFCMGALTAASFLSQLGSMDKFKAFINSFHNNEMATAVLPLLLQKVVHGLKASMVYTFLSNAGYPEYVSPDPKVKALLKDMGLTESMDNYEAFKKIIIIARINQKPAVQVHNIFNMIGHGKLSDDGKDLKYRKEFIGHIIPILNGSYQT